MAAKQSNEISSGTEGGGFIANASAYWTESKAEIKKVTWPTKKEVRVTSIAVLVLVVVMAIFLGLVDLAWTKIVAFILSPGA